MLDSKSIVNNIFESEISFKDKAIQLFHYQYAHCEVYESWCKYLAVNRASVKDISDIPFLPIQFFKSHTVTTNKFVPEIIFESSGTTTSINSKHLIKDVNLYIKAFTQAFEANYGYMEQYCVLALLPNYLERTNSSLVYMVQHMIHKSIHAESAFYLYDFDALATILKQLAVSNKKVLLIGVTFALLDFVAKHNINFPNLIIMETGGMKGRGKELTKYEVHKELCKGFGVRAINAEYGMTELLSQAYARQDGKYFPCNTMQVFVRDEEDPLVVKSAGRGVLNIIDLANVHSCAFIATDDIGEVYADGSFEIFGRLDNSDIRGCSLLVAGI